MFVQVKLSTPWWLTWMLSHASLQTLKALTSSLEVSIAQLDLLKS